MFENNFVEISIIKERFERGLITAIVNKSNDQFYSFFNLMTDLGYSDISEFLSLSEQSQIKSLESDDAVVLIGAALLKNYCPETLEGNFQNLGPGKNLYTGV